MGRKKSVFGRLKDRLTGNNSSTDAAAAASGQEGEAASSSGTTSKMAQMGIREDLENEDLSDDQKLMETELLHELAVAFDIYTKVSTYIQTDSQSYVRTSRSSNRKLVD